MIIWMSVVLRRTVCGHHESQVTSPQVVETSVSGIINSLSLDYTHPNNRSLLIYDMTPGFIPFTVLYFVANIRILIFHVKLS